MKSEKQLYQWDVNQYLTKLQPTAQFVDYPMGNEVIRIETDGKRCRIPDEFLQTAGFKTCYERYSDGTYKAYNFNVQSSPKPPDYVYTAEERTTFDALVAKADAAIAEIKRRADSGEFTPVKGVDYFTDAEKNELMESVSSGAVGDFRKVVDTSTTEYNDNHNYQIVKNSFMLFDLTLLFGAGNEPTAEQFEAMFPAESYPYNPGGIISAKTATIAAGAEAITTGFPELRSALAAHDYIDMDGEKVHRKIKSTKIDGNTPIYSVRTDQDNCCRVVFTPETSPGIVISEEPTIPTNIISDKLATITHNNYLSAAAYTGIGAYPGYASISMRLQDRTDLDTKEKVSAWLADNPTTVYYETESDELADVTIPEALTEWLPVEAGGTVTFRNADESKQLAVPNGVSWVRKLNEVN